ncbi:MAG: dienelactone hydrolase family protein [Bacteroidota bacterium]
MKYRNHLSFAAIILLIVGCKQNKKEESTESPQVLEEVVEIDIIGKEITYSTDSTSMKGYIAYDENMNKKRPGIIVIHEWWGHNEYVRERADQLAELGYTALAVDMYGDGKQASHPEDAGKFSMSVMSNLPEAKARFNAALELIKQQESVDPEKIAAIGYCFGGSVALTMANSGADLDAVAAFHSGVQLPVMPGEALKARVLVCNGADDPFISPESVVAFKEAMDATGKPYEYIAYPGAKHAFTSKAADSKGKKFSLPLEYNAEADTQSWASLQALFMEVF